MRHKKRTIHKYKNRTKPRNKRVENIRVRAEKQ